MMDATTQKRVGWTVGTVGIVACIATAGTTIWYTTDANRAQDVAIGEQRVVIKRLDTAMAEANRRLEEAGGEPVPAPPVPTSAADTNEPEIQEPEVQEPEVQDGEVDNPEVQDRDRNDPDRNDPEVQDADPDDKEVQDGEVNDLDPNDPEVQDEEIQDEETQDPEIQDEEVQNPEVDDPDPNSSLEYAIDDRCDPAEDRYVADVSARWVREGNTLTLVLTCTHRDVRGPNQLP